MRKSSPWLRLGVLVTLATLILVTLWFTRSAETPPWRQQSRTEATSTGSASKQAIQPRDVKPGAFGFLNYNVKNWLVSTQSPEKSAKAKTTVIRIIADSNPDIVGLCEIGSETDIAEIQKLLKQAGTDLPYSHHTGGVDKVRHLGILSRYPIVSSKKVTEIKIPGTDHSMQRGILDVTIEIDGAPVRFIGLHLKSKRIVPHLDQALLRVEEAQHLRNHVDRILTENPSARLVVYGDFNDHIKSLSTRTILGTYRSPLYLSPVHVKDRRGEYWTHFYDTQDSYSRIDFVTVSDALKPHLDRNNSRVIDDPDWYIASDHRPVLVSFK